VKATGRHWRWLGESVRLELEVRSTSSASSGPLRNPWCRSIMFFVKDSAATAAIVKLPALLPNVPPPATPAGLPGRVSLSPSEVPAPAAAEVETAAAATATAAARRGRNTPPITGVVGRDTNWGWAARRGVRGGLAATPGVGDRPRLGDGDGVGDSTGPCTAVGGWECLAWGTDMPPWSSSCDGCLGGIGADSAATGRPCPGSGTKTSAPPVPPANLAAGDGVGGRTGPGVSSAHEP